MSVSDLSVIVILAPKLIDISVVGLTSRAIAPYTKLVVGVDISQTSVDLYNEAVKNQGIDPSEMRAVCTELKGVEGELDGLKFDVITVCLMSKI